MGRVAQKFHSGIELSTTNDYSEVEEGGRGGGRQGRATMPSTVHPEILVVADSAFYKSMGRSSVAVQRYLTSYFNAVNMRFATVSRRSSLACRSTIAKGHRVSDQSQTQGIEVSAYDLSRRKDRSIKKREILKTHHTILSAFDILVSPDESSTGEAAHCGDRGRRVKQVLPIHRLPHQQGQHARCSCLSSLHGTILLQDKVSF